MLDIPSIPDSRFILLADKDSIKVNFQDIKKFKPKDDDLISIFIKTIIKLKTDINYKYVKKACEAENLKFDMSMVKPGKYEVHAYTYTVALAIFINRYASSFNNELVNFVNANLLKKKDELFFFDFKVDLEKDDFKKAEGIIDALSVKFYQELTLILYNFFTLAHKVLIIDADEKNVAYIFKFRNMNIMEIDEARSGKSIINRRE